MAEQSTYNPAGADIWKADSERYIPKPNEHKLGDSETGISGLPRLRLDRQTYYVPLDQRIQSQDDLSLESAPVAILESPATPKIRKI